jgi:hypothetical protein
MSYFLIADPFGQLDELVRIDADLLGPDFLKFGRIRFGWKFDLDGLSEDRRADREPDDDAYERRDY